MTTGKTIALTRQTLFGKVMSLLFSRSYIVIKMELHIFVTVFIGSRVSQLWLYCHSGLAVLYCASCPVGWRVFTASLASAPMMPVALPQWWQPRVFLRLCQHTVGAESPWLRTTSLKLPEWMQRECVFSVLVSCSWKESSRNHSSWGTCNPGPSSRYLLPVTTDVEARGGRDGVHSAQSCSPRAYCLALFRRLRRNGSHVLTDLY